jgi:hypothetical protein
MIPYKMIVIFNFRMEQNFLFYTIFFHNARQPYMDSLLQEIILFYKEKSSISYRKGNNTDGTVIISPSYRKLDKYYKDFSKPKNAVIDFVTHVASTTKSSIDEAAECILTSLLQHFEDSFYAAAVKNGVADSLRDALSSEALLTESQVQLSKARVRSQSQKCLRLPMSQTQVMTLRLLTRLVEQDCEKLRKKI